MTKEGFSWGSCWSLFLALEGLFWDVERFSKKEGGILCFGMFFYCDITKILGLSPKCLDKRKNKYLKFIHSEVAFMLTNAQRQVCP